MRVVLITGKGGVGKTTLAGATAVAAARSGARTLLVSTDAAHSLADVLGVRLCADPTPVGQNLDGLHLDGREELERSWEAIADYLRRLLGWADLDRLRVDELIVVPGLDQLLALARLRALADEGRWDAIVVDCAPSADSLRLLSLPDVLRWYVDRLFGRQGRLATLARRHLERSLALPAPDDDVLDSVFELTEDLGRLRSMLDDAGTTARIVVTPERIVLAEAQRTLAYLALYGYPVDAILVNRVPGPELDIPPLQPWVAAQRAQLDAISQSFAPLPLFHAQHKMREPIGIDQLAELGHEVYGEHQPLAVLADRPALQITTRGAESTIRMLIGDLDRESIKLERAVDDLVVTLGSYRRTVRLPDALRDQEVVRAGVAGGHLEVVFGEVARVG